MREGRSQPKGRLSHLAWLISAAFAAPSCFPSAYAQTVRGADDQTALGVPRMGVGHAPIVPMPQPLSPGEAARIRRIFALQASGSITEAADETARLEDPLLLGPILADRYLRSDVHPSAAELGGWLANYGDQPDAPAIRALLQGDASGEKIDAAAEPPAPHDKLHHAPEMVRTLFVQNRDAAAIAAAEPLLAGAGAGSNPWDALFSAGLAGWRLNKIPIARGFFEAAYHAGETAASRAAAAFWAARTAQFDPDRGVFAIWMRRAAERAGTFYAWIARRTLGPAPLTPSCGPVATLGNADMDLLLADPAGKRAFALLEVGQKQRAEAEFRNLWLDSGHDPKLGTRLGLLAHAVGLADLEADLPTGPIPRVAPPEPPHLHPAGGFVVDPPLVYALVRHESNFQPAAISPSGAHGLMQIKPATADEISGPRSAARLLDPAVNLAVGQKYLLEMSRDETVQGNLIRLLAGYAQGLYGMKHWADRVNDQGDPLLFIEAIPNPATREYVTDTLALSWRYAAALGRSAETLDALAAGRVPQLERPTVENTVRCQPEGLEALE